MIIREIVLNDEAREVNELPWKYRKREREQWGGGGGGGVQRASPV